MGAKINSEHCRRQWQAGERMMIPAKYENGVFRPLQQVAIKEGTVVEVHVPAECEPAGNRRSIKDLPFYGMWADRDDITDGASYVNRLRDNPRG